MQGDTKWQKSWIEERKRWGWLGKPPNSVVTQRGEIWEMWVHLSKRAKTVAGMSYSQAKVKAAKEIQDRRNEIIKLAERKNSG